jgi:hypothetical protein
VGRKVSDAAKERPLETDAAAPIPEAALSPPAETDPEDRGIATPFEWVDPSTIPPRAWIYGRHYIRKFVSTTVAPGGVGKTALGVVEALAITSGKPCSGSSRMSARGFGSGTARIRWRSFSAA